MVGLGFVSTSLATVMDATSYGGVAGALASVMPGVAATHADRLSGTTTIVLRPPPDGSAIDVGDVDIPGGVAVRFVASAPWATRLRYTGARGYMFKVAAGYRHVSFDGLIFEGGGVAFEGGARRAMSITNCVFQDCDSCPIRTLGASVIDVMVDRCWFNFSAGGISVDHSACDLWTVRNCVFNRNTDTDVVLASSGVTLIDCNFETRHGDHLERPHINVTFGLCDIVRCRFGPEVDGAYQPPQYPIVVGPIGGQGTGTIGGLRVDGCRFYGRNPYGGATSASYPDDGSAKAAIRLSKGLYQSHVVNNYFRKHATALVHEDFVSSSSRDNVWAGNVIDSIYNTAPIFTGPANGWQQ